TWQRNDLRASEETLKRFRVSDEIQVALAVANLDVLQAVPFFGHGQEDLREKRQLLGMHGKLAGPGAGQVSVHAHDIAQIESFIKRVVRLRNRVLANVNLQALARL